MPLNGLHRQSRRWQLHAFPVAAITFNGTAEGTRPLLEPPDRQLPRCSSQPNINGSLPATTAPLPATNALAKVVVTVTVGGADVANIKLPPNTLAHDWTSMVGNRLSD